MPKKIASVLIANRGEIAVRIAKTLARLGVRVYCLCSGLDPDAYHCSFADETLILKGDTLKETYLNGVQILALAKVHKIDAIHPGYGFLSENAEFAKACEDAGVIFIGPSSVAIAAMGSKANAKTLMIKAGIPVVPGYQGVDQSLEVLKTAAAKIGYPVLIKASAGGGGKGMRIVTQTKDLDKATASAQNEAQKAFGDSRLIIEKYITNPHHIEFQIFGDAHGNLIHLGERECSIQRRHQKIIEESPSPALNDALRTKMGVAAVLCGKALRYANAGTVEFVMSDKGEFYFLEVNTRLQVEHPVTEMRTGLDLVEWQIRVANGEKLPLKQADVVSRGHAIECRLYAEDAENGFFPSTGKILLYAEPTAPFLRIDSGVGANSSISLNFDPMLAKVIASGATRDEAISRLVWALENYPVLGVKTNAAFLIDVLKHADFKLGRTTTGFIAEYLPEWRDIPSQDMLSWLAAAAESSKTLAETSKASVPHHQALEVWTRAQNFRVGDLT